MELGASGSRTDHPNPRTSGPSGNVGEGWGLTHATAVCREHSALWESLISCCSHALKVQESLSVEVRLKRQVTRGKGLSKDDSPVKSATTSLVRRFLEVIW